MLKRTWPLLLLVLAACATTPPPVPRSPSVTALLAPGETVLNAAPRGTPVIVRVDLPNGALDATSYAGVTLRRDDNTLVAGLTSAAGDTLRFVPTAPLESGTRYTFSIDATVKDLSGAAFTPYSVSFTSEAEPSVDQPAVSGLVAPQDPNRAPYDGAITLALTLPNGAVDPNTLAGVTLSLVNPAQGQAAAVAGAVSVSGTTLSFTPEAALELGTLYRLSVAASVKDLSGAPLTPYTLTLTTEATPRVLVQGLTPTPDSTGVPLDIVIHAEPLLVRGSGVDLETFGCAAIRLIKVASGTTLCGKTNSNAGFTIINFRPDSALEPLIEYRFELSAEAKDLANNAFAPFTMTFTTGEAPPPPPLGNTFSNEVVFDGVRGETVAYLVIGSDGKLYGSSLDGLIRRWDIDNSTGALSNLQTLALPQLKGRSIIGLAFDPQDATTLWLAHNDPVFVTPACDFTSRVSRIKLGSGSAFGGTFTDYIMGLPRSSGDHFSNGLRFGPSGKLYLAQGSNTSHGDVDKSWKGRPERKLSAAILEIDPRRPANQLPINVQTDRFDIAEAPEYVGEYNGRCQVTEGNYDPFAANAPVTVYASGVRNAYDLVWHTNGSLYAPVNAPNFGGNTPASPDGTVPATTNGDRTPDFLIRAERGRYYGLPNPSLGHYVFNGGNPTSAQDPWQYNKYPVGVMPDPKWHMPIFNLGDNSSVNGILEYRSNNVHQGNLIVAEFAKANVRVLTVKADGSIGGSSKLIERPAGFPLALVENPANGHIYVAELDRENPGQGKIELLRPSP